MEDFARSKKTCKGAGQIFAQSLAPTSSATVPPGEIVNENPKLEFQLSTAIIEQLTLQEDKVNFHCLQLPPYNQVVQQDT